MFAIPGTVIGIGYILAFNASPYFWTYDLPLTAETVRNSKGEAWPPPFS